MEKLVSIVILNWNGKSLLEQFLPSVTKFSDIDNVEIVLADNGSTDKSIQFVKANYPQIKIIDNKGNFGFAGGYNKSLENLQSKYFVLLNSDVELSANWLPPLIAEMESDDTIFACQPKLLAYNEKTHFEYAGAAGGFIDVLGYPFCRGRIMDYCEKDEGQYDSHCEIFWASGACMMVRADLFKKSGGFDTDFFAHMEEIDLCWRMKNLGYKITFVPNSVVYHVGAGTLKKSSPRKTYLNFYNNRVMVLKNQNLFPFILFYLPREVLYFVAMLQFLLLGKFGDAKAVFKAGFDFIFHLFKWIKKRKSIKKENEQLRIDKTNTLGLYNLSIVYQFFILKNKTFKKLKITSI